MQSEFVGSLIAFKGEDEVCTSTNILIEVTEVQGAKVEVAFDAPIPGKPRIYVSFQLPDLVAHAMREDE